MKYLLPTLTGLRLSFLPCAVVKMRRRVLRASQASPFGDPENDTGSVLRTTCPSRRVSPVSAVSPACPFCLSADRPRFEGLPFGFALLPRKEVIQPHLPIRLPCYDFTPVIDLTLGCWLLAVTSHILGAINSHGVTGGVYKARERIHRGMLIRDY